MTKDADFSHRALTTDAGPAVVHLRVGNMLFDELDVFVAGVWPEVSAALLPRRWCGSMRTELK
ncbi:MAG: hypothetical protein ACKVP3_27985 [Hyphomicrobiaceae bacterium]